MDSYKNYYSFLFKPTEDQKDREHPLEDMKGSRRHIAELLNSSQKLQALDRKQDIDFHVEIEGVLSPRKEEGYKEDGNAEVLEKLGLSRYYEELTKFWPKQGHHWDGVAKAKDGTILLIEAKAHISEMDGAPMDDENPETTKQRHDALKETATYLGAVFDRENWTGAKYQMANRLAFAYFLSAKLNKPARVVYIVFTGDTEMTDGKDETIDDWRTKFLEAIDTLGLATDDTDYGSRVRSILQWFTVPVKWLYE